MPPAIVEQLIAHRHVRRVNFTGSTHVGRIIAAARRNISSPSCSNSAARRPLIVLDDADLDAAVDGVAFGAFANSGQICMSTERIIVGCGIADVFVDKLAAKARSLIAGDPLDPAVVLGSIVDMSAVERVATR